MKWISIVAMMALGSLFVSGCGNAGETQGDVGELAMTLRTVSPLGVEYRLRNALFQIDGPEPTGVDSEDYSPNQPRITVALTSGDYEVTLGGMWYLEYSANGQLPFTRIDAVPISPNPASVRVIAGRVAFVTFAFEVDEGDIDFGPGDLSIGIDVIENDGAGGAGGAGGISGSTTWRANTDPAGGGNVPPVTGGCQLEVAALGGAVVALDVALTLDASLDASDVLTTGYTVTATNPLLPALQAAAEYTALSVVTNITDGTPATVTNEANPAATGTLIGAFIDGSTLTFATPDEISENAEVVTSTSDPMEVNFAGEFNLVLTAGGLVVALDESICSFDVQGAAIEL